jgi:hypothetical protein
MTNKLEEMIEFSKLMKGPSMMIPYYMILSYAYYEKDESLVSDEYYDRMCQEILENYDEIKHPHKKYVDTGALLCGTGFQISEYPNIVKGAYKSLKEELKNG